MPTDTFDTATLTIAATTDADPLDLTSLCGDIRSARGDWHRAVGQLRYAAAIAAPAVAERRLPAQAAARQLFVAAQAAGINAHLAVSVISTAFRAAIATAETRWATMTGVSADELLAARMVNAARRHDLATLLAHVPPAAGNAALILVAADELAANFTYRGGDGHLALVDELRAHIVRGSSTETQGVSEGGVVPLTIPQGFFATRAVRGGV
jgi:hypothetical protein